MLWSLYSRRPCDNCRSRRQRCDIPSPGAPCLLCVETGKQCTFLRERRKASTKKVDTELFKRELGESTSIGRPLSALTAYILRARSGQGTGLEPVALDDEAAVSEELFLVGTASERDALMLNTMTGAVIPGPNAERLPGIRLRTVALGVHFVFSQSLVQDGRNILDPLCSLIGDENVNTVLQA